MSVLSAIRKCSPLEWAGPIFTKELRVTSRRRRHYVLRFAYLLILLAYVMLVWLSVSESVLRGLAPGSGIAALVDRMAVAGREIIYRISWFQFYGVQVLAVLLLSDTLHSEITAGTLGVLMSTPISGFQIVLGKLASRLMQVFLLLLISLPLMAVVRVFGGVPWPQVTQSLLLTVVASIFTGSIALYLSCRRNGPLRVIILTVGVYLLLVQLPTWLLPLHGLWPNPVTAMRLIWSDGAMRQLAAVRYVPTDSLTRFLQQYVWAHYVLGCCWAMLSVSVLLIWRAAKSTRKLAMWAANQSPTSRVSSTGSRPGRRDRSTRLVSGSALIWKDMRFYLPASRKHLVIAVTGVLAILVVSYAASFSESLHRETMLHFIYLFLYMLGICLVTLLLSATAITTERESRALAILLTAPISDGQIIQAKVAGVLRRVAPLAALMLAHLVLFTILPSIHPLGSLFALVIMLYTVYFLIALGIYCSTLVRTSTNAIMLTLVIALGLWLLLPLPLTTAGYALRVYGRTAPASAWKLLNGVNPFVQMEVVLRSTSGEDYARLFPSALQFHWTGPRADDLAGVGPSAAIIGQSAIGYGLLGSLLLWRATKRLRKNIFTG